jgi:molybdate transport system substrate-binding protein
MAPSSRASTAVAVPALRLMHSNSTHALLHELLALYEEETGDRVETTMYAGKIVQERIAAGERADALVMGTPVLKEFERGRVLVHGSVRPFARARVAVAVRCGERHPDISTPAALAAALLASRCVAHTVHGASGKYIPTLFERLGIGEAMRLRTITRATGPIGPVVVSGEADLALQQLPELLPVEGLAIVGLIPESLQLVLETSGGVFSDSGRAADAAKLLDFLGQPAYAERFSVMGLEQVGA